MARAAVKPLTIVEAVEKGDRLAELRALHLRIAQAVSDPKTPARDLAALSKRQVDLGAQIVAAVAAAKAEQEEASGGKKVADAPLDPSTL